MKPKLKTNLNSRYCPYSQKAIFEVLIPGRFSNKQDFKDETDNHITKGDSYYN